MGNAAEHGESIIRKRARERAKPEKTKKKV